MLSSRMGSPERSTARRRRTGLAGLAVAGLLAGTGCQVEYAGMTLPSGKYMHDDVQYFPKGPEFPYANTQAATQRARMNAQGIPIPQVPGMNPVVGAPGNPAGMPGGNVLPRPIEAPEAENLMPGGAAAPNPALPGPNGMTPGGEMPAPMPPQ
jgi:hypothetical protein